jgi:hypothetical protein
MSTWVRNKVETEGINASTTIKKTTTAVATTSQVIAAANPNRKGFYIWNNSSNSVYISFADTSASAGPTFILATFQSHVMVNGVVWQGVISAIRNSGSGNIVVWELE